MTGLLALHGGGEFLPGDEPFLRAILGGAATTASVGVVRAVVVPTSAARGLPDLAGAHGVDALRRVAVAMDVGLTLDATVARIVDATSAADPTIAAQLAAAHLVHFPGGDPDLIPTLFPGTSVWAAIRAAWERGAVLAGASAGAMAMAQLTWTPTGVVQGLGLVPGVAVVPHADAASWARSLQRFGAGLPAGIGLLGLAERTGVIGRPGEPWIVVGAGEVRWQAPVADAPVVARDGDELRLDTPAGGALGAETTLHV